VESLGARLKREREQRKITLEEISLSTKIGTRFLLAIEGEQFDQLPGGIFNKGFVKAYARSVGVDEAEAVAEYELAVAPAIPETQPAAGVVGAPAPSVPIPEFPLHVEDTGDDGPGIPWEWFAAALLIVAFCFALWGFHSRDKSFKPGLPPRVAEPANIPSAEAPVLAQTAASEAAPPASAPAVPAGSASAPSMSASAAPAPSVPGTGDATPRPEDSEAAAGGSASSTPGAFLVQIKAREDSWVAISADGREIMQATLNASAEKSIGARDRVVIKTGNAGALDISFNGKKLPTQGAPNEVKTLTFDPSGPKL
jgi:cytoskeleton protein RodZ